MNLNYSIEYKLYLEINFLNNDYALWVLFSIFVGIALSIDLGIFRKLKNIRVKQKTNPIIISSQEKLDSEYESTQKIKQTRNALWLTIVWISLASIFAVFVFFNMGY